METPALADLVQSVLTSAAILVGGGWTLFYYLRERVFHPRVVPSVTIVIGRSEQHYVLVVVCSVKNTGLTRVDIAHDPSALEVLEVTKARSSEMVLATQTPNGVWGVFKDHRWIESGEEVLSETLISVAATNQLAFHARLRVVGKRRGYWSKRHTQWCAESTVFASAERVEHSGATAGEIADESHNTKGGTHGRDARSLRKA